MENNILTYLKLKLMSKKNSSYGSGEDCDK